MKKLFISYSRADEAYKTALYKHLSILKKHHGIELWSDKSILPGEEWNERIMDNMRNSDIFLFLLSSDFLSSKECYEKEAAFAFKLAEEKKVSIIPVIVRPCGWKSTPFEKLHVLPQNANPISKWDDKDEAYNYILDEIIRSVKQEEAGKKKENKLFDNIKINNALETIKNLSAIAKNYSDNKSTVKASNNADPNPNYLVGRWQLVQSQVNGIRQTLLFTEYMHLYQNFTFQVYKNQRLSVTASYSYHQNWFQVTFSDGDVDSRQFSLRGNELVLFSPREKKYSYYRRVQW